MGIIGMLIAIITTLNNPNVDSVVLIVLGIIIGESYWHIYSLKN